MGEHLVQFYHDETCLVDEIWEFISPSLRSGEAAVVIATRERLDILERKYAPSRLTEIGCAAGTGPYIALDATSTLAAILKNGWPDESLFNTAIGEVLRMASKDGVRHVRAYGEMVALLCADGKPDAAIRLEELWNAISDRYPFSLLCGYPMHAFSEQEHCQTFTDICHVHTHVRPTENYLNLADRDELNRMVAMLQQKAGALESEVARRKKIEHALHQREQELSDFLENAVEGMHRVGPDGTVLWANKAELDLLGYSREEYIGRHIAEFHADHDTINDILSRLLAGETLYDYPARMLCKDGSIKHVLIHSNACVTDGEFISTRCLMRDVTDRVRLEMELNSRLEQLAEVDRRKDEFLAMLGHELRNPLAPITNSLELMRLQENSPEQITRCRETIVRQVSMMTRLVDDLLDVSRITRGKIELKMEPTTLHHIVDRAVEIVRPLIDERRHLLSMHLPADSVALHGDPARLAQVLANLLHNAAKYTDPGGSISLSAREESRKLVLIVADNGIGLDKAAQEKIFDLFVQDANSLTKARGGLGIGLTLVRSLVRLHGGEVSAHSEGYGRGSEFMITLPLREMHAETQESRKREEAPTRQNHPRQRRILIVDDNIDAAESLGEFLKVSGHMIHLAHDGLTAIDEAIRLRPDVVILDIGMPLLNGYEVAQRLREEAGLNSALLLAVTGYAQMRDRICAQEAGFDHHFAKPLDIRKLEALLNAPQ